MLAVPAVDPLSWAILLMLIGCGLVVMEVFVPSGGILGFLSAVAIVASIVMAFRRDSTTGISFIVVTLVAVPTMIALAFKYWPMTPMGKAFLGELPDEEEMKPQDPRRDLVGRVGIAKSKMLPSGSISIDGRLFDAMSQGQAIDVGQPVVVVEVRANRVVVRPADPQEAQQANKDPRDVLSTPVEELGLDSLDDPLS
jgi:membrane-bound serine protease (ClpP class)